MTMVFVEQPMALRGSAKNDKRFIVSCIIKTRKVRMNLNSKFGSFLCESNMIDCRNYILFGF